MLVVTSDDPDTPESQYDAYPNCSNKMDITGPIVMDKTSSDDVWRVKFGAKKAMYGAARMPVGTSGASAAGKRPKDDKRTDDKLEP
eukprot:4903805-Alexandrium_andersonii.AAC.1